MIGRYIYTHMYNKIKLILSFKWTKWLIVAISSLCMMHLHLNSTSDVWLYLRVNVILYYQLLGKAIFLTAPISLSLSITKQLVNCDLGRMAHILRCLQVRLITCIYFFIFQEVVPLYIKWSVNIYHLTQSLLRQSSPADWPLRHANCATLFLSRVWKTWLQYGVISFTKGSI